MAGKAFDPDDPMALAGMVLPLGGAEAAAAEVRMAETFIEEYALMGFGDEEILGLFRDRRYRFSHAVYCRRGEAFVRALLARVRGVDAAEAWHG